jgi:hypothetical protein
MDSIPTKTVRIICHRRGPDHRGPGCRDAPDRF